MKIQSHTPGKAYGYIRVSSRDQVDNGISLLAQEETLAKTYEQTYQPQGYGPYRLFREEGVSAFKKQMQKRPEGSKLLSIVQPGDMILLYKLERAFRNVSDGSAVIKWLTLKPVRIVVLDMGGTLDSGTAAGMLGIHSMLATAEFFSHNAGERVKDAQDYHLRTRGFGAHIIPGHMAYKAGPPGRQKKLMKVDQDQCLQAEACLGVLFTEGIDSLHEKLKTQKISVVTRHTNGTKVRPNPLSPRCDLIYHTFRKSVLALYYTGRLEMVANRYGRAIDTFFRPVEGKILNPNTERFVHVKLPRTNLGLPGTAA